MTADELAAHIDAAPRATGPDGEPLSRPTTCGECGRTWDDAAITHLTPVPSGRCPFEYDHEPELEPDVREARVYRVAIVTEGTGTRQPTLAASDISDAVAEAFAYEGVGLIAVHVREITPG